MRLISTAALMVVAVVAQNNEDKVIDNITCQEKEIPTWC